MVRRSERITQEEHNETRMRRAWSWWNLSKKSKSNREKFIFLWIAFNAAYGTEIAGKVPEQDRLAAFAKNIVELDRKGKGDIEIILRRRSSLVQKLLNNKYVFWRFWEWVKGDQKGENWESELEKRNERVRKNKQIAPVLEEVLMRLYVLRNQIIHGGTTFDDGTTPDESWGREQVTDGCRIMEALVPVILEIMQNDIDKNPASKTWGKLDYPRVGDDDQPDRTPGT